MRIRRSLATTTTTANSSSDPDHDSSTDNLLQTPCRCSNNNKSYTTNNTKTSSIIICFLNQSPWDVTDLSSLQLDGGLFSLTGTTAPVALELPIGWQSFASSVKLCVEEASDKCSNRIDNADSGGLSPPEVKIKAEKSSTGGKVVSLNKPQIGVSRVKKQQIESSDVSPESGIKRRGRAVKKSANEFYYYSGFGPHWGKKRETITNSPVLASKVVESYQELRKTTDGGTKRDIEYVDYDDDGDDMNGEENEGRRRPKVRKRVKARSLKSLM